MDSSVLNYVKTFRNTNPTYGNVQNYNVNRWGEGNMAPMKTFNYGGKTYYLAPSQKMSIGRGGWDEISDPIWDKGTDVSIGKGMPQNYRMFDFDPFSQGHNITPGAGGGDLLKAFANFLPIAAAVLAPPLLAGLGGGAAAGGAAGTSAGGATGAGTAGAAGGLGATEAAGAAGAGGAAAAAGGGGGATGGIAGTSLLPTGSAYGGSLGATATGSGLGLAGPGASTGVGLTAGGMTAGTGAGTAGGGLLGSISQFFGGLSNAQKLSGVLGLGDLAMRLWQQNELGNIANEAANRSDPMNQPQRFPFQNLARSYATGRQNIMTQPAVKAAYDLGMNDVMAKTAKFSDSGQAWKAIANNSNNVFQSTALPYLDWLGTMGGFKQGPGYAGQLYGQYASQATGAPFLGVNSAVNGLNVNNNGYTGALDTFRNFFSQYENARRNPMTWNASVYNQN